MSVFTSQVETQAVHLPVDQNALAVCDTAQCHMLENVGHVQAECEGRLQCQIKCTNLRKECYGALTVQMLACSEYWSASLSITL